ncbi:MAG: DUF1565 domain-containing protein [Bacteroidales bacterium]|nr:DUF1565 domain-containing protein [Bacteroidales bacterium]
MKPALQIFSLILLFSQTVQSQIITVKQDSTGDYTIIQDAVDAAANGDTVLVWPGAYFENVAIEGKNICLGSLTLTTGDETYINQTIINGNQTGSCIKLDDCPDTTIVNGLTLENGSGSYCGGYCGSGIYIKSSIAEIFNCVVQKNQATTYGGGIYCHVADCFLSKVTIRNNHAFGRGGGLTLLNSSAKFDSINKCNIYLNYAAIGTDIYKLGDESPPLIVVVDTFTIAEPDHYFLFSDTGSVFPANDITFDIDAGKVQTSNQDLFVNQDGNNKNSGLTNEEPLKDVCFALLKIASDSVTPNTIHLANGTYSPTTGEKYPLSLRKNVSIEGANRDSTILDAGNEIYLLHGIPYTDNYSISNLTIRNGNGDTNSFFGKAGAFLVANRNILFENVLVTENSGSVVSGINCMGCSNVLFKNVEFLNNHGGKGLRIIFSHSEPVWDTVYLENCRFVENQPLYDDPEEGFGGGLSVFSAQTPNPTNITAFITNCLFENNHAKDYPFGASSISLSAGRGSNVFLVNCTMADNTSENIQGANIGQVYGAKLHIYNSIMYNNNPSEIYMFTDDNADENYLNIYNSLLDSGQENIRILSPRNNIFYDDQTNIDTDPLFLGKWEHPYQIADGSPCIDAGTLARLPDFIELPETDLAGNPRIVGDSIDMGAYEWNPTVGVDENLYRPIKSDKPKLLKAAPNPFSSSTTLSAKWDFTGHIQIEIYNNAGLRVKVIKSGRSGGLGSIQTRWDGKDQNGNILPAGIYHVVMFWEGKETEGMKVVKL